MIPFQFPELVFKITSEGPLKITPHTIRRSAQHKLHDQRAPGRNGFDNFDRLHIRLGFLRSLSLSGDRASVWRGLPRRRPPFCGQLPGRWTRRPTLSVSDSVLFPRPRPLQTLGPNGNSEVQRSPDSILEKCKLPFLLVI